MQPATKKIAWTSVEQRYPEVGTDSYTVCNDGNIYKSDSDDADERYPECPGCGKRHKPHGLFEILEVVFGRG